MAQLKKMNRKPFVITIVGIITLCLCRYIYTHKGQVLKEYSKTGELIGTNEYVIRNGDTILNGNFVNYNKKGNKISEGLFVNGEIYGKCIDYYDNGNIKNSYFKKTSKITLEAQWNYSNEEIETYSMYSDFGAPLFIIKYDKKGIVDSYKGSPQLEIYQHKLENHQYRQINNKFKVGDVLKYSYFVANIPKAERSFTIKNLSTNNSEEERTLKHIEPCQWDVKEVLIQKGKNRIRSIVEYKFNDRSTPVFRDTISFEINVD